MSDEAVEPVAPPAVSRRETIGSLMELVAMSLAATAGFLAPTDWNLTFGFATIGGCLFLLGFFALADE